MTLLGSPVWLYLVIGVSSWWLWRRRRGRLVAFLVVTLLGAHLVDTAVKLAVGRTRPALRTPVAHAIGKSFPSGHAMVSVACYGALLVTFLPAVASRRRGLSVAVTILLLVAIGVSRLALGVHYVSDVVGGWLLGAAWLMASVAAFEVWREERGRRRTDPLHEGLEPEGLTDTGR